MDEKMKVIGRKMSIRMGILMSFSLALVGTLTSGHFTPVGFVISFFVSTVVSLVIGFVVPVGKLSGDFCRRGNCLHRASGLFFTSPSLLIFFSSFFKKVFAVIFATTIYF